MENDRPVPCSPKTLARRITSTKSFFRWLHQYGVLMVDPAEKVLQRSVISPLPTVLSEAEVEAVLGAADRLRYERKADARPFTLLRLLLATGIKKSECLGIHLNHIDLDAPDGSLVFIRYASPANRYKERKIPLPEDWVTAFQEYLAQYQPVDQLFPWSPRRLEYLHDTFGGQSGSPLWVRWRRFRTLVGIHTTRDVPGAPVANTGTRITPAILADVRRWSGER